MSDYFDTDTETYRDYQITVGWFYDEDLGPPWKEHDGHGIVSDWEYRDKKPGELILNKDGSAKRFYDFTGSLEIAKHDGWGLTGEAKEALAKKLGRAPTEREVRVESVMRDFKYLKDWCHNKWFWCGFDVKVAGLPDFHHCVGGIDSPSREELLNGEALPAAREAIDKHIEEVNSLEQFSEELTNC